MSMFKLEGKLRSSLQTSLAFFGKTCTILDFDL